MIIIIIINITYLDKYILLQEGGAGLQAQVLQIPGAAAAHVRCSGVVGLTEAQGAQLEAFHNGCLRQMMGLHRGPDGPSTAELLARTGQANMADHMRWHRVRWLGHATRKPNDVMVKQLLFVHSILAWMDTAMHDMGSLGRTLQMDLPQDWANLALYRDVWRGVVSRC